MGNLFARDNHRVENIEINSTSDYFYPPKHGNFFADHFIMGGEKFKAANPECFLFGDNGDLAYMSNKPAQFPYKPPIGDEPSRTLKTFVHLRKDSLKLTRVNQDSEQGSHLYNVEFIADCDVQCSVQIFLFAAENLSDDNQKYVSRNEEWMSEIFVLNKGSNQTFSSDAFQINPDQLNAAEFEYVPGAPEIPVVIQLSVMDNDLADQMEMTLATFEKSTEGTLSIKPLKQKIIADGLCYIIEEIYGIENKREESSDKDVDDDDLENGSECVICMCDMRDTLILPCRHLCLCNSCANSLRFQSSTCPICRSAFYALLQLKAVRRKPASALEPPSADEESGNKAQSPNLSYEEVPLIEALNGEMTQGNGEPLRRRTSSRKSAGRGRTRAGSRSATSRTSSRASDPKQERGHSRASSKDKSREDRSKSSKSNTLSCPNLRETSLLMSANTSTDESDSSVPRCKSSFPRVRGNSESKKRGTLESDEDSIEEIENMDESIVLDESIPETNDVELQAERPPTLMGPPIQSEEEQTLNEEDLNETTESTSLSMDASTPLANPGSHIVSDDLSSSGHISIDLDPASSASLPGTPMGSDDSSRSVSSISFHHLPIAIANPIYNAASILDDDNEALHDRVV